MNTNTARAMSCAYFAHVAEACHRSESAERVSMRHVLQPLGSHIQAFAGLN